MSEARQQIMKAIREGVQKALLPGMAADHPPDTNPRGRGGVAEFVAEVERLSGQVIRVSSPVEASDAVASLFRKRGWDRVLAWEWGEIDCEGLPEALAGAGVAVVHGGDPADLEPIPVGLTGAEAALADTGTIVVRNGPGRSPLASLLPPVHVVLLDARRVLPDMHTYFESLSARGGAAEHVRASSNLVFISGPSRTADIEQSLTLGVHGPRELIVILWEGTAPGGL